MESTNEPYIPPPPSIAAVSPDPTKQFEPAHPVAGVPQKLPAEAGTKATSARSIRDPSLDPEAGNWDWCRAIVRDAFSYPWRKDGWAIVIPGAVISIVLAIGMIAPGLGIFVIPFAVGYFAAYYFSVIETTISGRDSPPDWPEVSNFLDDVLRPAGKMFGVWIFSYLPASIYLASRESQPTSALIISGLELMGSIYHPMACLAVVMHGTMLAVMPHKVLPAIARCLPGYILVILFLLAVESSIEAVSNIVDMLPSLLAVFVIALYSFCLFIVQARITGLAGRRFRDKLAWG